MLVKYIFVPLNSFLNEMLFYFYSLLKKYFSIELELFLCDSIEIKTMLFGLIKNALNRKLIVRKSTKTFFSANLKFHMLIVLCRVEHFFFQVSLSLGFIDFIHYLKAFNVSILWKKIEHKIDIFQTHKIIFIEKLYYGIIYFFYTHYVNNNNDKSWKKWFKLKKSLGIKIKKFFFFFNFYFFSIIYSQDYKKKLIMYYYK